MVPLVEPGGEPSRGGMERGSGEGSGMTAADAEARAAPVGTGGALGAETVAMGRVGETGAGAAQA
jgi:hypothetical protein